MTGAPFVNSIVGGPYRTHWWRNRLVNNHVDPWVWGRYRTPAKMLGDTAVPPYADWASIYGSNLQDQVKVDPGLTGSDAVAAVLSVVMPVTPGFDKVADLLAAVSTALHGSLGPLESPPNDMTDPAALREAYLGTLAVLWFMTGNQPFAAVHPGPPPAGAEVPPQWYVDGSAPPAPSGGGGGGASGGATISAILALILGILTLFTSSIALGCLAIGLAIASALQGDPVDWPALRINLYWLRMRIFDALLLLQTSLVKSGLAYPSPRGLGTTVPVTDDSGVALTRSRTPEGFPRRMESGANGTPLPPDSNFRKDPSSKPEKPTTRAVFASNAYPDVIVDGTPMMNGGMLADGATFPTTDTDFGGAVANATDLIRGEGNGLRNFNLDGDRGYGWKTWKIRITDSLSDENSSINPKEA